MRKPLKLDLTQICLDLGVPPSFLRSFWRAVISPGSGRCAGWDSSPGILGISSSNVCILASILDCITGTELVCLVIHLSYGSAASALPREPGTVRYLHLGGLQPTLGFISLPIPTVTDLLPPDYRQVESSKKDTEEPPPCICPKSHCTSGLRTIADLLNTGAVCGVPTDTVYALAASCKHPQAIEKVYRIKV